MSASSRRARDGCISGLMIRRIPGVPDSRGVIRPGSSTEPGRNETGAVTVEGFNGCGEHPTGTFLRHGRSAVAARRYTRMLRVCFPLE
jgi:hypothetical protein